MLKLSELLKGAALTAAGLSAYFLKGVVPSWDLKDIYFGMMQFMVIQLVGLALLFAFPQLVLWLPKFLSR